MTQHFYYYLTLFSAFMGVAVLIASIVKRIQ